MGKYKLTWKDLTLRDFKIYLFALFKAFIPKKKIKSLDELEDFIQTKISLGVTSYFVWLFKDQDGH